MTPQSPKPSNNPQLRTSFDRLCSAHGDDARRFARLKLGAVLRRRVDSDDVRQEVFLEAWRVFQERPDLHHLAGERFVRWMGEIVRRKVLSLARHHVGAEQRSVHREVRPSGPDDAAAVRSPSEVLMGRESVAKLEAALQTLSPREQEVIRLVHFDGLRLAQAAKKMGKTPGATSVLLCEALGKLEARLGSGGRRRR